jgi:hypothetical protein
MACSGSGQVISSLGGTPNRVTCPWCRGTGQRIPGIDAQERFLAGDAGDADDADREAAQEPPAAPS